MEIKEIAKRTNKSIRHIGYILSGERRPSPELAETLEKVTGIKKEAWIWPEKYGNPYIKPNVEAT